MSSPDPQLSDLTQVLLLVAFGVSSLGVIELGAETIPSRVDLLLLALSSGAIVAALLWLVALALGKSRAWALSLALGIWVPYLNFILVSIFARRHWREGARAPALLALLGVLGQTVASVRLLVPRLPSLV